MIYFSIDIETMGLCAGIHSMISLGAAAIDVETGEIVGKYKVNLTELPGAPVEQSVLNFWAQHPEANRLATENAVSPETAIPAFVAWVKSFNLDGPVAAFWKPHFDAAFLRYYLYRFYGNDLFGRYGLGLDIKTLTALATGRSFVDTKIGDIPSEYKNGYDNHTHDALDDAIEQAFVLYNARKRLGGTL